MAETRLLKQIRALVVTMAFLSVVMPSPITYATWWKDKPELRKYYIAWAIFAIITAIIIYKMIYKMNDEETKEISGVE